MLVQLTALLALGVLCSSAPTSTPPPCSTVDSIIKEVHTNVMKNGVIVADLSSVPTDVKNKNCMRNNLETFMESLAANQKNENALSQLNKIYKCEHLFPKVPGNGCKTANVSKEIFMREFENFLRYLYGEL